MGSGESKRMPPVGLGPVLPERDRPLNHGWNPAATKALAGALVIHATLAGCATSAPSLEQYPSAGFICEGGTFFSVQFSKDRVRVETGSGVYNLVRRPSSIGRKYASADATFILDEERAVLTGADGGPFRRCHAV